MTDQSNSMTPSERISNQIAALADWRGEMLARLRQLIREAVPDITEDWKWGSPVWSKKGLVCSVGVFKNHVKLQFFRGASLEDPKNLFNAGHDAKSMRSIDFREGSGIDETNLKELIRAAVLYNMSGEKKEIR